MTLFEKMPNTEAPKAHEQKVYGSTAKWLRQAVLHVVQVFRECRERIPLLVKREATFKPNLMPFVRRE